MERFFGLELTAGLLTIYKERHNPNLHHQIIGKQNGRQVILVLRRKEILTHTKTQMNLEDILLAKGSQAPRINMVQLDLADESRRVHLRQGVSGACPEIKNGRLLFHGHDAFHLCKIKESPGGVGKKRLSAQEHAHPALAEDKGWLPNTQGGQLSFVCNSSYRAPTQYFLFGGVPAFMHTFPPTHTHTVKIIIF